MNMNDIRENTLSKSKFSIFGSTITTLLASAFIILKLFYSGSRTFSIVDIIGDCIFIIGHLLPNWLLLVMRRSISCNKKYKFGSNILKIMSAICGTLGFGLYLISSAFEGRCSDRYRFWTKTYCEIENRQQSTASLNYAFIVLLCPIFLQTFGPKTSMRAYLVSFIISFTCILITTSSSHNDDFVWLPLYSGLVGMSLLSTHAEGIYSLFRDSKIGTEMDSKYSANRDEESGEVMKYQTDILKQIITNIIHDLLTPIQALEMGLDTMNSYTVEANSLTPDNEYSSELVQSMQGTLSMMSMIVNRCMDVFQASEGAALVPQYETFRCSISINKVARCVKNMQSRVSVSVRMGRGVKGARLRTDKRWFEDNIQCILSNAVKFSRDIVGMCVEVKIYNSQRTDFTGKLRKMLTVEVWDCGAPLVPEEVALLFKPPEVGGRNRLGGAGLGLFSLAMRVDALGGLVGYFPRNDGKCSGSVFWFAVPFEPAGKHSFFSVTLSSVRDGSSGSNSDSRRSFDSASSSLKNSSRNGGRILTRSFSYVPSASLRSFTLFTPPVVEVSASGDDEMAASVRGSNRYISGSFGGGSHSSDQSDHGIIITGISGAVQLFNQQGGGGGGGGSSSLHQVPASPHRNADTAPWTFFSPQRNAADIDHAISVKPDGTVEQKSAVSARATEGDFNGPDEEETERETAGAVDLTPFQNLNILAVDDSITIMKILKMNLTRAGHKVDSAANGALGLKMMMCKEYDVVLVDLEMDQMDGRECVRKFREYENEILSRHSDPAPYKSGLAAPSPSPSSLEVTSPGGLPTEGEAGKTPEGLFDKVLRIRSRRQLIIAMCASGGAEARQEAFMCGMDAFLAKPFTREELVLIVAKKLTCMTAITTPEQSKRDDDSEDSSVEQSLSFPAYPAAGLPLTGEAESRVDGIALGRGIMSRNAVDSRSLGPTGATKQQIQQLHQPNQPPLTKQFNIGFQADLSSAQLETIEEANQSPSTLVPGYQDKQPTRIWQSSSRQNSPLYQARESSSRNNPYDVDEVSASTDIISFAADMCGDSRSQKHSVDDELYQQQQRQQSLGQEGDCGSPPQRPAQPRPRTRSTDRKEVTSVLMSTDRNVSYSHAGDLAAAHQREERPNGHIAPSTAAAVSNLLTLSSSGRIVPSAAAAASTKLSLTNSGRISGERLEARSSSKRPPGADESGKSTSEWPRLSILIVEDSLPIMKAMTMNLVRGRHSVDQAVNGLIALHAMKAKHYDVVMMDLQMPEMGGCECTKLFREFEATPGSEAAGASGRRQLIVGMSANIDSATQDQALSSGMDAFLAKPFKIDAMMQLSAAKLREAAFSLLVELFND